MHCPTNNISENSSVLVNQETSKPTLNKKIEKRIFVVGCPRSGTTLLQSYLAAHPDVVSFPETQLFTEDKKTWTSRQFVRLGLTPRILRNRYDDFLSSLSIQYDEIPKVSKSLVYRSFINKALKSLDAFCMAQKKRVWVEKTPRHLHEIDRIRTFLPQAYFIHITRHPFDNIASFYELANNSDTNWFVPDALTYCVDQWLAARNVHNFHRGQKRYIHISYEDLTANTETQLKNLCQFLGLGFHGDMLNSRLKVIDSIVLNTEVWKRGVKSDAVEASKSKFDRLFNQAQKNYITERLNMDFGEYNTTY